MFRKITIPLNQILEPKREHAMPQVEVIQFDDVPEDGLIDEGALIPVNGMLAMSPPDGGCGLAGCGCFRGHFITRLFRRDDEGCVRGYVVEFESRQELETTSPEELSVLVSRAMNWALPLFFLQDDTPSTGVTGGIVDAGSDSQDGHNEWSGDEINEFEPETNRAASTEVRRPGFHAVRDRYTIGKGRHTAIPDLLTYPDSIIVGGIKKEILTRVIRM